MKMQLDNDQIDKAVGMIRKGFASKTRGWTSEDFAENADAIYAIGLAITYIERMKMPPLMYAANKNLRENK